MNTRQPKETTAVTRPRPETRTCKGCGEDYLPHWGFTLTVAATTHDVCMGCAQILHRLGVLPALKRNDDKEG